jgi:hypothetical protein
VWLYDETTLVSDGRQAALRDVAATNLEPAISSHGAPTNRAQFQLYRDGFAAVVGCLNSTRPPRGETGGLAEQRRLTEA